MKILCQFLFTMLLITSCATHKIKSDTTKNTNTIGTVLNNWHNAASTANFENYFNSLDKSSIFIGTDTHENWTKEMFSSFSKPFFDKGKAWDFKVIHRNIYLNDTQKIAWFDENLNTWMGICRGSGVLEYKENTWKIKHYVLSITVPNDHVKTLAKLKSKSDSIYLKSVID